MSEEWSPEERTELGEVLSTFASELGQILSSIDGGHDGAAEPAKITSYSGLAAGCSHVYGMGVLLCDERAPAHSVVALARSAVESFGRAWRTLLSEDADERNALSREMRIREVTRAVEKGLDLNTDGGHDVAAEVADLNPNKRIDEYVATAEAMLQKAGLSAETAKAHYSFMSGIAHGESLSIDSMSARLTNGRRFVLSKKNARAVTFDVFMSAGYTTQRFLHLYSPAQVEDLARDAESARRRLQKLFPDAR